MRQGPSCLGKRHRDIIIGDIEHMHTSGRGEHTHFNDKCGLDFKHSDQDEWMKLRTPRTLRRDRTKIVEKRYCENNSSSTSH